MTQLYKSPIFLLYFISLFPPTRQQIVTSKYITPREPNNLRPQRFYCSHQTKIPMKTRQEYLNALVNFDQPLSTILPILKTFPWDSSEAIITLKKEHLIDILDRYLHNALSATDLENWADAIECREDIAYKTDEEDIINDIIFDLANPTLNDSLSPKIIEQYISQLSHLKSSLIA